VTFTVTLGDISAIVLLLLAIWRFASKFGKLEGRMEGLERGLGRVEDRVQSIDEFIRRTSTA
jgi:hypothetical protein